MCSLSNILYQIIDDQNVCVVPLIKYFMNDTQQALKLDANPLFSGKPEISIYDMVTYTDEVSYGLFKCTIFLKVAFEDKIILKIGLL